jgi:3-dehydroquinate dehydratase/shikimate dehydrogenase
MTYLAVPIAAENLQQVGRQIRAAKTAGAEMLELRTDFLEALTVELAMSVLTEAKKTELPVIVTCREPQQGAAIHYPLQLRLQILAAAARAGADFIDCELDNFIQPGNQQKLKQLLTESVRTRLILSAHNFQTKFENIHELYRRIRAAHPPAIAKLVYTAGHINDCFEAFDLLKDCHEDSIVFAMGPAGVITRLVAKKLGSLVTFASIDESSATAPGQLTAKQFKCLYHHSRINTDTELFGVIGAPVAHSLSPDIHNACFAELGLNKLYLPLLVEGGSTEFECFVSNVLNRPWLGFRGFSITIPHKQNALEYMLKAGGWVKPLARKIGAINTLVVGSDGKVSGHNTDYTAALQAITRGLGINSSGLKGLPVAVIGAGGVARAIVAALCDAKAKVKIYNRTVKKAEDLAREFGCESAPLTDLRDLDARLLVNCTSIGMHPNEDQTPIPAEYLKKEMAVFDTVYNPAETLLLKQAKQIGCRTISGLDMFISQAAEQFKLFTGRDLNLCLAQQVLSAAGVNALFR